MNSKMGEIPFTKRKVQDRPFGIARSKRAINETHGYVLFENVFPKFTSKVLDPRAIYSRYIMDTVERDGHINGFGGRQP
jgi:hypothetical protein